MCCLSHDLTIEKTYFRGLTIIYVATIENEIDLLLEHDSNIALNLSVENYIEIIDKDLIDVFVSTPNLIHISMESTISNILINDILLLIKILSIKPILKFEIGKTLSVKSHRPFRFLIP